MTYNSFQRIVSLALVLSGLLVAMWHTRLLRFATDTAELNHRADETRQKNLVDTYMVVHTVQPAEVNMTDIELSMKSMEASLLFNESEETILAADDNDLDERRLSTPPPATVMAAATTTSARETTTSAETTTTAAPDFIFFNTSSSAFDPADDRPTTTSMDFFLPDNFTLTQNATLNLSSIPDSIDF
jgi:hypothetical protein